MIQNKIVITLALLSSLALGLQAGYIRDDNKKIVLDSSNGLMWQDDNEAKTITKTWSEAIEYCEAKELGDYSDWRLPNYNELYNLVDKSRNYPLISPVFTQVFSDRYWSSSTFASNTSLAWNLSFYYGDGYAFDKTLSHYVRCIRGGL